MIFLWVDEKYCSGAPFWSILGSIFRKIINITKKTSEKAENIKVHINLRSHADFHENPSIRKKLWHFENSEHKKYENGYTICANTLIQTASKQSQTGNYGQRNN